MPTGLEMIERALGPDGSDAFAAVTCYQGLWLRDHWEEATDAPWWAPHDPDPDRAAKPWLDLVERSGEDWYPVMLGASASERRTVAIELCTDGVFRVNRTAGERRALHREPSGGWQPGPEDDARYPAHGLLDADALGAKMDSLLGPPGGRRIDDSCLDLPRLLHDRLGAQRAALGHVSSPWWRCSTLWGFAEMMTVAAERQDLAQRACERFLDHCLADVAVLAAMGARVVWIEDCMSDLISPALFRKLGVPFLRRLTEAIRAKGMLSVHYYCGRPDDRWDMLLDTGADALALEESKKGFAIDIVEVADRVAGRMALLGNVDAICLMEHGSDLELQAEVERKCEAGRRNRGRFVVSVGSPITPGTPLSRVRRYCDLVHDVGHR